MLKISFLELFLRIIPESFLIFLLINILSKKNISKDRNKYILSSLLLSLLVYLIRLLPIHFGIHFILNIISIILITTLINKISINKSIGYSVLSMILLSLCEWVNLFIVTSVLKINEKLLLTSPLKKIIFFMPSLIIFIIVVLLICKFINKSLRGNDKCV